MEKITKLEGGGDKVNTSEGCIEIVAHMIKQILKFLLIIVGFVLLFFLIAKFYVKDTPDDNNTNCHIANYINTGGGIIIPLYQCNN